MKIDIKQLEFIDKKLRKMVLWIENVSVMEPTITSLYRIGDSGVHGTLPLRGIDLRVRVHAEGEHIEKLVNQNFKYDPKRPGKNCAKLHGEGFNLHLHLQVHPNTVETGIDTSEY